MISNNNTASGDVSSGKSSLLAKLSGNATSKAQLPVALEYTYLELFAEDSEGLFLNDSDYDFIFI